MMKLILSLCDYTGNWSRPYCADHQGADSRKYLVRRVDIKKGEDVTNLPFIKGCDVHGIIAQPPCTEFAASGARWWADKQATCPEKLERALHVAQACLSLVAIYKPEWWVLENPVGRIGDWIGACAHTFQPFEYAGWLNDPEKQDAERYTKRTCLWGDFIMPAKKPLDPIHGSKMHSQYGGSSERTKEMRSITPEGFATAFKHSNP